MKSLLLVGGDKTFIERTGWLITKHLR